MIKVPSWIEEVETNLTRLKPLHRQYEACQVKSNMKAALQQKYDKLIRDAQKQGWLPDSSSAIFRRITGQDDLATADNKNASTDPALSKADQDASNEAQLEKKRREARAQQQQEEEEEKEKKLAAKAKEAKRQAKLAKQRQQHAQERQQAQQAYDKQKAAWQSTLQVRRSVLEKIQKSIDTIKTDKDASARQLDELTATKDMLVNQLLLRVHYKTKREAYQGEGDDRDGAIDQGNATAHTTTTANNDHDDNDILDGGGYSWQIKR
jgi:hypothetical protein